MRLCRPLAALTALALASTSFALGSGTAGAAATDLFISEYIEGTSFNKAIEIFNGTGAPVDLAAGGYVLELYSNGSPTPSQSVALTGTIPDGGVHVVTRSDAGPAIVAQADQLAPSVINFNGDDAVALRKGTTAVDVFGQIGVDPGTEWGTGLTSTADNTLRRKSSVSAGDPDGSNAFDPAVEWDGFAIDTFDGLGAHTMDGGGGGDAPVSIVCGPALTTVAGTATSRIVTATDPDDTVTDISITSVTPSPAAGTISRTAFTPAPAIGGTATATISVDGSVPAGTYAVALTASNGDGPPQTQTCTLSVAVQAIRTIGEVQGPVPDGANGATIESPLTGQQVVVRAVVTQKTLARSSAGASQNGLFLQDAIGATDGDPTTSDGIFVFLGGFTTLLRADGGPAYLPAVGDELVLRANVTEFFALTQLTSPRLITVDRTGLDPDVDVEVVEADPPVDLADANRYWERHEGMRIKVPAGSVTTSGRDVFPGTADSEVWLIRGDDPLAQRSDPYARRVFRDAHPLDDLPTPLFDNGNGSRIMIAGLGVKAASGDSTTLLPPARLFDTLTEDAVGGLYFTFSKFAVQVEAAAFTPGVDPSTNAPPKPARRDREVAVSTYNVENLYDFRDDPTDGCDFVGNTGCPGVSPPFDYVPASQAAYDARILAIAEQITNDLHSPDLLLTQESEDQDICRVVAGVLTCDAGDGKPDTLQELALAIQAAGGGSYDAALDRNGADDRGIVAGFLYRTDRLSLAAVNAADAVLGSDPGVVYRAPGLVSNSDVQNPKSLNADLPADVDTSTGTDGSNVYTRAPQVARFRVQAEPGRADAYDLWAISNHFSSTPNARVGQRAEQAAYGAAIVDAIETADPAARVVFGGDLNVYPRPDDAFAPGDPLFNSDQLSALYDTGLHNLWEDLAADVPSAAYSYVFQGQGQTLDHLFVNDALYGDLVEMRAAHVNAGWPADYPGDGSRGLSDHDPQVARFTSKARLTVSDVTVTEGDKGTTPAVFTVRLSRPLSTPLTICAVTLDLTAKFGQDYDWLLGCKVVAAGQTETTITVRVRGDRKREADEHFALVVGALHQVVLEDPLGIGTIRNDD